MWHATRSTRVRILIGLLVVALASVIVVVVVARNADSPPAADHPFVVDLGPATPDATSVAVGGNAFPLGVAASGRRTTQVALTVGAGGVAFVRAADGSVLGTAPVWSMPGLSTGQVPATCDSTAFDQVLLTPGLSDPNPLAVDIMWGLANRGAAANDLHQLGALICSHSREPHGLAAPDDAEIRLYGRLVADLQAGIDATAGPLPPLGDSLSGISAATGTGGGPARPPDPSAPDHPSGLTRGPAGDLPRVLRTAFTETSQVPATTSRCGAGRASVAAAGRPDPSLALCADDRTLAIANDSAAWAFLYPQHPGSGGPLAIVPGRSAEVPSLEKIIGAVAHDVIANDLRTGCALLSWLDVCHPSARPPASEVLRLFDLVHPGDAETATADGYYSIAWGDGRGDRTAFPAGLAQADIDHTVAMSRVLTFFSGAILPFVAVVLDHQITPELDVDQLPALLPLFDRLIELFAESTADVTGSGVQGHVEAVGKIALRLVGDPQLLGAAISAFAPRTSVVLKDVLRALPSYLVEADVPVAGWAVLLVRLVDEGSAAANAFVSVADLFTAETKPSYASWPGALTSADATALPATTPQYDGRPTCPVPPTGVAIPGAPDGLQCLWNVTVDLDGNGRADHLVLWSTARMRGGVGLLDDDSAHPLVNAAIATADPDNTPWQATGGDAATPLRIYTAGATPRQQVLIGTSLGAHGWAASLVGLAPDGRLLLATDDRGDLAELLTLYDLGCATVGGRREFVMTSRGNTEATAPTQGPYGISSDFYTLTDALTLAQDGYAGSVTGTRPTSGELDNDCGTTGAVPTRALGLPADTPQEALRSLLEAVALRDPVAASAYVGGAYADFDNGLLVPDVYGYTADLAGVDPKHWLPYQPVCRPDPTDPGRQNCSIEPPDGSIPLRAELGRDGRYWTVDAIGAG